MSEEQPTTSRQSSRLTYAIIAVAVAAALWPTYRYLNTANEVRNARVRGHVTKLVAPVDGLIAKAAAAQGGLVKRGDPLLRFENVETESEIKRISAEYQSVFETEIKSCLQEKIASRESILSDARLAFEQNELQRVEKLWESSSLSNKALERQRFLFDEARNIAKIKELELQRARSGAQKPIWMRASLRRLEAQIESLIYESDRHLVRAPSDGYVERMLVETGVYVAENDPVAVFIPFNRIQIEANVLENRLSRYAIGTTVDIIPDIAPDTVLEGEVVSIIPAVAAAFSGVARNDVDSNWIRVTQRVPIIIEIVDAENDAAPLPVGASVTVRSHTNIDETLAAKLADRISIEATDNAEQTTLWRIRADHHINDLRETALSHVDQEVRALCVASDATEDT
ncbi:MAG: HlyD family efflux transporter periplasmic adaptor subunit [Pseudomonadota bacterium]